MARERLGEILLKAGLIDRIGLNRALERQAEWGGALGGHLIELGLISEETLLRALSAQYKVPAVVLDPPKLDHSLREILPSTIAEKHNVVCFRVDKQKRIIDVAMVDPGNHAALAEIRFTTRYDVRPHIASPRSIDEAITHLYFGDVMRGELDLARFTASEQEAQKVPKPVMSPAMPTAPAPSGKSRTAPPIAGPAAKGPPPINSGLNLTAQPPHPGSASPGVPGRGVPSKPLSTTLDEGIHITMDVPKVEKERFSSQGSVSLDERLAYLEATVARNTTLLQVLLGTLAQKGILNAQEINKLVGSE